MSHSDLIKEEVEETVYMLIELGIVEAYAVDEDGSFIYRLTKYGEDVGGDLENYGLIEE